jgi:hypothetical protein
MEHATPHDTAALLAEIDDTVAAYTALIDRGLALAAEMRRLVDTVDARDKRPSILNWFGEWW